MNASPYLPRKPFLQALFSVSLFLLAAAASPAAPAVEGIFGTPIKATVVGTKASALAIEGTTLYCGVSGVLHVLDVSTPTNPVSLGSVSGLYHIRQIAVENGLVAVSSRSAGAWLIDATTPTAPRILSHYETVEQATGIDIAGNLMAIGQRTTGVEFVDITDRANPRHIRMVRTQESQSCRYENGILYSGDWHSGKVNAIDVTDLSTASIVGATEMQGYGDGFDLDGRYLYASTGHHRLLHGSTSLDANYGWGHALEIWDRSDVTNPVFVSRVQFDKFYKQGDDWWSCQEADGWVFCSDTHNGLYAVDARDPANPTIAGRFTDPSPSSTTEPSRTVNSVVLGNGAVYTTTAGSGLWVIPCDKARYRVRPRGAEPTASNLAWREPYATTEDSHFRAWKPPVHGPVHSVAAYDGRYYVGCGSAGAYIIDAATLRTTGSIPCAYACDVKISGDRLFIAQGDDGLGIYSLENPQQPSEIRRITKFGGNLTHVEWVCVPTPRWAIVHARCETGKWWFLDLDQNRTTYPSSGPSIDGMTWVRPFANGLVGGKWLGYTHTHYFPKWFDMSGDTPVLFDTVYTNSAVGKTSWPNYIEQGTCTPIVGDRLLISNRSVFTLLEPGQDHNADGSAWPTFGYANSSLKPPALCWWDGGTRVGLASTQGRKVQLADFTMADCPNLLWQEDTAGNPENGAFAPDGRLLVPCGYQGLLVEKRENDVVVPTWDIADAEGFDHTNRLVTVTGLTAGDGVVLTLSAPDGSLSTTFTALADDNGVAVFDIATEPGRAYAYSLACAGDRLGSGGFFTGGWNVAGSWFLALPDGLGGSTETNGTWTTPPAATNATRYVLGGREAVFALTPGARAEGEDALVRVDTVIDCSRLTMVPDLAGHLTASDGIVALTATTNWVSGGAPEWCAWAGGVWTPLCGDIAPAEGGTFVVQFEGDFSPAALRVRFAVSNDGGTTFASLSDAATGAEWLVPSDVARRALSEVAVSGTGGLGAIRGTLANAWVAEAGGVYYASLAEALRATGPGVRVTLLANATAPSSLVAGRDINENGHVLMVFEDFGGTLILLQ